MRRVLPSLKSSVLSALVAVAATLALTAPFPVQAEVKVGVSDWPGWVAWYVAEQKGFFKKHGADVKLVWFANYTDSISALSSGQLDANSQTWSDTMGPLAKGLPLKTILVNDNSGGVAQDQVFQGFKRQEDRAGRVQRVALRAGHRAGQERHEAI